MSPAAETACGACGAVLPAGARFCMQCGAPAVEGCPGCGSPIPSGARFCMQCGTRLGPASGAGPAGQLTPQAANGSTVAERRLVSVLFADLVGFTTLSEHRDPEEVRELLSQYFDRSRTIIARYGGTVEKFIGDAVMAVWGTPVAREDDAERAVRAALSLTSAITALGEEVGMPSLRVRAGVLTGNAAVEVGVEGEGMVLGDTVNTASRLQSIAAPGTVLVDDVTKRASEAAVAYEESGTHRVKGREQPVRAWTALRVVAGARGSRREAGLEAPLSGRNRELQAIIDAGERSAEQSRAELMAVVGEAGLGKSRLLWEFYKYLDGIQEVRWWMQGRCLSYGEGVAYWALAEMVRGRARIAEEDPPGVARDKLRATVEEHVPDERERRLVEPRLAHLLRLEDRPDADRADLFSGWRLYLERLAQVQPLIMAFEDLQWADSGLLEFIDYLMEWSAEYPIFVIALGRTELQPRRPTWQPLVLQPLAPGDLRAILDAVVPGLPDAVAVEIVARAEGNPLYAVETIRMLQDRGLLVQRGAQYVLTGEVDDLEVPETLHALVASRLDGLSAEERALLQNASVLGQTFSPVALAAVSKRHEEEVQPLIDALVAKQILSRDDDIASPERGQYAFLQALLRTVAYGTLSRRTRKALHLAAAEHMRETWRGEVSEIAEVLADHYLEAIQAAPEAPDVGELRASARETLTAAGRAAASLTLGPEADRYFEQAAALAEDGAERAGLYEQAGDALIRSGDPERAMERLRQAMALMQAAGDPTGGSAAVTLGDLLRVAGHAGEAEALLAPFRESAHGLEPVVHARALLSLSLNLMFGGKVEEAGSMIEKSLARLEDAMDWPGLADGLITRGVFLIQTRRPQEGLGVLRQALAIGETHDLPGRVVRARFNIAGLHLSDQRLLDTLAEIRAGLAVTQEQGDRSWDLALRAQAVPPLAMLGRWDEALREADEFLESDDLFVAGLSALFFSSIAAARGNDALLERCGEAARRCLETQNVDVRSSAVVAFANLALIENEPTKAAGLAREGFENALSGEIWAEAIRIRVEAALATADKAHMEELAIWLESLPPARKLPLFRAGAARLRGELGALNGGEESARRFEREAEDTLREMDARPLLAVALLDRVRRHGDEQALAEARQILEDLGATRWLDALPSRAVPAI
ncbi:MAG TPA: adenylate/guanylate cyclase domain-containing protein [Solirubrobacteraceae bacterium]|nr:adenylate/guanylate cyclase domain-containing protein [Solirubrobacteraceae bacterium]